MRILAIGSAVMAAAMTIPAASAQMRDGPAISGYGKTFPTDGAQTRPDAKLRYRVLFNITKAAPSPDKLNPSVEKVARSGISARHTAASHGTTQTRGLIPITA